MSTGSQRRRRERKLGMLPIIGLIFAALLAGVAYGLSPIALKTLASFNDEWDQKLRAEDDPATAADESEEFDTRFRYLFMLVIWLSLMGVAAVIAAAAVGKDPEQDSLKQMAASPANRKAMVKQLKRDLKEAKRRAEQQRKQAGK